MTTTTPTPTAPPAGALTRGHRWTILATVSGLPPGRAGVAGAITSTARQLGTAAGIAVAGGLIAGRPAAELGDASRPGWLIVAACGAFLLVVAGAAKPR